MENLRLLNKRIVSRINANLREFNFDAGSFAANAIEYDKLSRFYCLYGVTSCHPIDFNFRNASMAGSYFLGKCSVNQSIIYKSDIRGDELKRKGDIMDQENPLPLIEDETIVINNSLLYKTLVHHNSRNPETPEEFTIRNTVSSHYANIHGATMEGCFLGPFSTIDLMDLHSCIIGEFSYIQAGELFHKKIDPGVIHIETDEFCFKFKYKPEILAKYIGVNDSFQPRGLIYNFVTGKEPEYEHLFRLVDVDPVDAPDSSAVNRHAVIKGDTRIGENVLISQGAYLNNALMGDGSNAQENTYIIDSRLMGMDVTAHGGKVINTDVGQKTFVGFNSFLFGKEKARLIIGKGCVVMPHTIIDIKTPLEILDNSIVWGYITCEKDLKTNSIAMDKLNQFAGTLNIGDMIFKGNGKSFIDAFVQRIEHILEANGAYCKDGSELRGHAQNGQQISFNILHPYRSGNNEGIYPSIRIRP
ncbi:MAG: transferase [Deltaproteobacteria bacterium]|nr:transferase [Deltaproteobacteria bacterium]